MMHGYGGFGWFGMILGLILTMAILIGLVLLVVWAVRKSSSNIHPPSTQAVTNQSAKDIAQARYARGEITRDEYQQILSDLNL